MGAPIRIGDQEFHPRRETYEVLLGREELDEREGELVDEANGLMVEMQHTFRRLTGLVDKEGDFDADERERLKAQRKELRAKMRAAQRDLFRTRIEAVALRLDPTPEVDWLLANLDEAELEQVMEALSARPTETGSDPESDEP